jgi:hypothetical protein
MPLVFGVIAGDPRCFKQSQGLTSVNATIISNRWTGATISLLVALAFGLWSLSLGQDRNWDLLNYHLYNPYAFLNDRTEFDLAPAGAQTFFSPMLDIIYFSMISHLSPRVVGFLLGFLQGLNFFLLYKIAGIMLREHAQKNVFSLLLALGGVLTVGFLAEVGSTMHDSLVALFPLLSLWMILCSVDSLDSVDQRPVWALVIGAGLIAGTGIGLKLVSAIYALPLCLALLVLPLPFLRRFKLAFVFGLAVLAGMLLIGGYWLYETWRLFGNPLFPQFNNHFQGELAVFSETRDLRFLPRTLFDKFFYPVIFTFDFHRVAELKYQQYSWLVAYVAVLGLLVYKVINYFRKVAEPRPWAPEAVYLLAFFCISYFLWLNIFGIYRYLAVIEFLIPLLLFVIITNTIKGRLAAPAALIFLGLLTLVNLRGVPDWGHAEWADTVYSVESTGLQLEPEPAAIFLAGQPMAWIVPAMDIRTPFIQIVPNFGVSEAYWQRAKILSSGRSGKRYVIYESDDPETWQRSTDALLKLNLSVDDRHCGHIHAFLGKARSEYRFCELKITEPR